MSRHLLKSADCVHFHFSCGDFFLFYINTKKNTKKYEIQQDKGKRKQSAEIRGTLEDALPSDTFFRCNFVLVTSIENPNLCWKKSMSRIIHFLRPFYM